jgi:23S rRNA A1618 N6-methylase RlmF
MKINLHSRFAIHLSQITGRSNKGSLRKVNNLESRDFANKATKPVLNFGDTNAELWCEGELGFITQMIYESAKYPMQCWFYLSVKTIIFPASIKH